MITFDTTTKTKKLSKKRKVKQTEDSVVPSMESEELENVEEKYEVNGMGSEDENDADKVEGNPGWADAMQKILKSKKPKRKKTVVLSKAKKLCDVAKREKPEKVAFEIEKVKEEVKTEEGEETESKDEKALVQIKEKRKHHLDIRVKPSITDRERERMLQKIATKGVVQLFNAVRQQQGDISKKLSEAGPLERKREQVLKNIDKCTFLDVLMGGSKSIQADNAVKNEDQEKLKDNKKMDKKMWNVLRDDFVMGTKLKDWDRNVESDNDSSAPEEMDSDN